MRASLQRRNAAFADDWRDALDELSDAARRLTPFAFFAHVLGPLRGRAKMLARLGPEANDALDEFLNLALDLRDAADAVAAGLRRTGCARRKAKCAATWSWRATKCA